uniref:CID domain-containing protein n=1 Tax=Arion vulgaris TaxID=1028688 RepID=A0A0B7AYJ6_9EUPU
MSDDVTDSYRSSLDDLKMNSKPQISMLTMLAEDHEQFASDIVRVIEEQIKKILFFNVFRAESHPQMVDVKHM